MMYSSSSNASMKVFAFTLGALVSVARADEVNDFDPSLPTYAIVIIAVFGAGIVLSLISQCYQASQPAAAAKGPQVQEGAQNQQQQQQAQFNSIMMHNPHANLQQVAAQLQQTNQLNTQPTPVVASSPYAHSSAFYGTSAATAPPAAAPPVAYDPSWANV